MAEVTDESSQPAYWPTTEALDHRSIRSPYTILTHFRPVMGLSSLVNALIDFFGKSKRTLQRTASSNLAYQPTFQDVGSEQGDVNVMQNTRVSLTEEMNQNVMTVGKDSIDQKTSANKVLGIQDIKIKSVLSGGLPYKCKSLSNASHSDHHTTPCFLNNCDIISSRRENLSLGESTAMFVSRSREFPSDDKYQSSCLHKSLSLQNLPGTSRVNDSNFTGKNNVYEYFSDDNASGRHLRMPANRLFLTVESAQPSKDTFFSDNIHHSRSASMLNYKISNVTKTSCDRKRQPYLPSGKEEFARLGEHCSYTDRSNIDLPGISLYKGHSQNSTESLFKNRVNMMIAKTQQWGSSLNKKEAQVQSIIPRVSSEMIGYIPDCQIDEIYENTDVLSVNCNQPIVTKTGRDSYKISRDGKALSIDERFPSFEDDLLPWEMPCNLIARKTYNSPIRETFNHKIPPINAGMKIPKSPSPNSIVSDMIPSHVIEVPQIHFSERPASVKSTGIYLGKAEDNNISYVFPTRHNSPDSKPVRRCENELIAHRINDQSFMRTIPFTDGFYSCNGMHSKPVHINENYPNASTIERRPNSSDKTYRRNEELLYGPSMANIHYQDMYVAEYTEIKQPAKLDVHRNIPKQVPTANKPVHKDKFSSTHDLKAFNETDSSSEIISSRSSSRQETEEKELKDSTEDNNDSKSSSSQEKTSNVCILNEDSTKETNPSEDRAVATTSDTELSKSVKDVDDSWKDDAGNVTTITQTDQSQETAPDLVSEKDNGKSDIAVNTSPVIVTKLTIATTTAMTKLVTPYVSKALQNKESDIATTIKETIGDANAHRDLRLDFAKKIKETRDDANEHRALQHDSMVTKCSESEITHTISNRSNRIHSEESRIEKGTVTSLPFIEQDIRGQNQYMSLNSLFHYYNYPTPSLLENWVDSNAPQHLQSGGSLINEIALRDERVEGNHKSSSSSNLSNDSRTFCLKKSNQRSKSLEDDSLLSQGEGTDLLEETISHAKHSDTPKEECKMYGDGFEIETKEPEVRLEWLDETTFVLEENRSDTLVLVSDPSSTQVAEEIESEITDSDEYHDALSDFPLNNKSQETITEKSQITEQPAVCGNCKVIKRKVISNIAKSLARGSENDWQSRSNIGDGRSNLITKNQPEVIEPGVKAIEEASTFIIPSRDQRRYSVDILDKIPQQLEHDLPKDKEKINDPKDTSKHFLERQKYYTKGHDVSEIKQKNIRKAKNTSREWSPNCQNDDTTHKATGDHLQRYKDNNDIALGSPSIAKRQKAQLSATKAEEKESKLSNSNTKTKQRASHNIGNTVSKRCSRKLNSQDLETNTTRGNFLKKQKPLQEKRPIGFLPKEEKGTRGSFRSIFRSVWMKKSDSELKTSNEHQPSQRCNSHVIQFHNKTHGASWKSRLPVPSPQEETGLQMSKQTSAHRMDFVACQVQQNISDNSIPKQSFRYGRTYRQTSPTKDCVVYKCGGEKKEYKRFGKIRGDTCEPERQSVAQSLSMAECFYDANDK